MPAPYWGYIDPQREELQNALLRAQIRQMETQTGLAEELGAQGRAGVGAGVRGGAVEDDSLQWEQLEFQREQLKEQTELAKAQQLILERKMTLAEEEAQAPFQMGLGEILLSAQGEPMVVPGTQVEGAWIDPLTGEPRYQAPIVAGLEETVLRPGEGVMKAPQVKIGSATLITPSGEVIYSEPETSVSGAEMIVTNRATGEVINRIDISQVPKGFEPQVDAKGNLYVTNLDTGESELASPSAYYEMEYEQEDRKIKATIFGIEVQSKGYDVIEYKADIEKYIADKAYDRVIDVERIKQDTQDSANLTAIEKQQLVNKAEALKVEATDRRTDALLVGYDIEKYGHDIKKYIADVGYDETMDEADIRRDIQNSKNATDIEKQELIRELGVLTNESKERMSKAEIEAGDRKLITQRYTAGYMPQTAEEAIAYVTLKAQVEAKYDPFTTPNMMNVDDAEAWLSYKAGIDLFTEKGKTDEKIRFELIKARAAKSPEDLLKETSIKMMEITEAGELGRALLEVPITEAGIAGEQARLRGAELGLGWAKLGLAEEELELKREGEAQGEAGEEMDELMDMMLRATATHKPTYGMYGEEEKVMAANTLLDLIRLNMSISPETKMKWLETAPSLLGVTLPETLAGEKGRPYFDWFRDMWNQSLSETAEVGGIPRPTKTYKGLSFDEIRAEVNRIYGETGSRKKVNQYLKKYGMSIEDYKEQLKTVVE